jgi:hypothetical protein
LRVRLAVGADTPEGESVRNLEIVIAKYFRTLDKKKSIAFHEKRGVVKSLAKFILDTQKNTKTEGAQTNENIAPAMLKG